MVGHPPPPIKMGGTAPRGRQGGTTYLGIVISP
jgi:hypothetical protein